MRRGPRQRQRAWKAANGDMDVFRNMCVKESRIWIDEPVGWEPPVIGSPDEATPVDAPPEDAVSEHDMGAHPNGAALEPNVGASLGRSVDIPPVDEPPEHEMERIDEWNEADGVESGPIHVVVNIDWDEFRSIWIDEGFVDDGWFDALPAGAESSDDQNDDGLLFD